jgi:hypothetical protein
MSLAELIPPYRPWTLFIIPFSRDGSVLLDNTYVSYNGQPETRRSAAQQLIGPDPLVGIDLEASDAQQATQKDQ